VYDLDLHFWFLLLSLAVTELLVTGPHWLAGVWGLVVF
jgi:hypothetical protein